MRTSIRKRSWLVIAVCLSLLCVAIPNSLRVVNASGGDGNIALSSTGTTVTASSFYSQRPKENVNNGNYGDENYWRPLTADSADNEIWLTLDFNGQAVFSRTKIDLSGGSGGVPSAMLLPDGYEIKYLADPDFHGSYSDNRSKWTTIASRTLSDYSASGIDEIAFTEVTASKLAFVFQVAAVVSPATPAPRVKQIEVYGMKATGPNFLAPADLSQLQPSDFADKFLYVERNYDTSAVYNSKAHMPFFLAHFNKLVNSVVSDGPTKGFIDLPVWRETVYNQPYNARIMENVLSLAYFYTANESWNTFYGSPIVKQKLEDALGYWLSIQSSEGLFSEYGVNQYNLPATAFAAKFMGETLRLLSQPGPTIDEDLLDQVIEADRKAIMATLTKESLYTVGKRYSNQYGNIWAGALEYLELFPGDTAMAAKLEERLLQSEPDFQSPAGFFYEQHSTDWGYNMGTHRNNTRVAWHYAKGTDLQDHFVRTETAWYNWLAYNTVPEPDGSAFLLNRGIEARQQKPSFQRLDNEIAEAVPLARAFAATDAEAASQVALQRSFMRASWPNVAELTLGDDSFTPYHFLSLKLDSWAPTEAQRNAALGSLPYFAADRLNHVRADSRVPLVTAFAGRPLYYASFNGGQKAEENGQQRFGIGLLWNRHGGTFLQTQTNTDDAAWGTKASGAAHAYEAQSFQPALKVNGYSEGIRPGRSDLPLGTMSFHYALGGTGSKSVSFEDTSVSVNVYHQGEFTEYIPLMTKPGDVWTQEPGKVTVTRGGVTMAVYFPAGTQAALLPDKYNIEKYRVKTLTLTATGQLPYTLSMTDAAIPYSPPPVAGPEPNAPVNLALAERGTVASASSQYSGTPVANVNDGNHLAYWRPLTGDTADNEVWLSLNFGREVGINRVALDMSGEDGTPAKLLPDRYTIKYLTDSAFTGTYDDDPSKWQTAAVRNAADFTAASSDDVTFAPVATSRLVVVFQVPAVSSGTPAPRVKEIQVFGAPAE